ncbi:MAG: hypothetical protein HY720_09635 [Planctomycetes bacterium]|nr:hypothetical protein [Planctomycetota bacterium]
MTYLFGAGLLLVGFFLPWIDAFVISFSGFEIPRLASLTLRFLESASRASGGKGVPFSLRIKFYSLYSLYLIPVTCLIGILVELSLYQRGRNSVVTKILSAVSPLFSILVILIDVLGDFDPARLRDSGDPEPNGSGSSTSRTRDDDGGGGLEFLGVGFYASALGMVLAFVGSFINPGSRVDGGRRARGSRWRGRR